MHGVDEGGDVAAFGFSAGEAVLLFPSVPVAVIHLSALYVTGAWRTISPALVATARRSLADTPLCRRRRPLCCVSTVMST